MFAKYSYALEDVLCINVWCAFDIP